MAFITGMYYEDFKLGMEIETLSRTVTESDIMTFAGLTGDFNPLHTDAVFASKSMFGSRIAHGMLGFSIASGLMIRLNIFEETIVANYGVDNWRYRAPIRIGDTIRVIIKPIEKKESEKGHQGVVTLELNVLNQDDISTMGGNVKVLMKKRP